ncbi:MAG TPA: signal peptidase I [Candidatus Absconditabacterales bacterium]|nr:signal peptidase I [Candidatus Absconditabacterales bacterium]
MSGKIFKNRVRNVCLDLFDMLSFLVFVLGIVLFVRFFVANPYTVVGSSMAPTFHENDFIIVDKISQRLDTLGRGDIIVFVPDGKTIPYIKRIIALPGETVKIKDGSVFVCDTDTNDCEILDEIYLPEDLQTKTRCGITEFDIKEGYFVLGDNRGFSTDSLCCFGLGCYDGASYEVMDKNIIGKVLFRVFPDFGAEFY